MIILAGWRSVLASPGWQVHHGGHVLPVTALRFSSLLKTFRLYESRLGVRHKSLMTNVIYFLPWSRCIFMM